MLAMPERSQSLEEPSLMSKLLIEQLLPLLWAVDALLQRRFLTLFSLEMILRLLSEL